MFLPVIIALKRLTINNNGKRGKLNNKNWRATNGICTCFLYYHYLQIATKHNLHFPPYCRDAPKHHHLLILLLTIDGGLLRWAGIIIAQKTLLKNGITCAQFKERKHKSMNSLFESPLKKCYSYIVRLFGGKLEEKVPWCKYSITAGHVFILLFTSNNPANRQ